MYCYRIHINTYKYFIFWFNVFVHYACRISPKTFNFCCIDWIDPEDNNALLKQSNLQSSKWHSL